MRRTAALLNYGAPDASFTRFDRPRMRDRIAFRYINRQCAEWGATALRAVRLE
ncbi:hypothetical protein N234_13330 [Ralstonia pickettii DTP0602]|nr:hypothetical protein N234_13330 [Ralstonia pickettii DTP0602]